ncbi:hypothetical protein Tco_0052766 [Tanacetum coccineum]
MLSKLYTVEICCNLSVDYPILARELSREHVIAPPYLTALHIPNTSDKIMCRRYREKISRSEVYRHYVNVHKTLDVRAVEYHRGFCAEEEITDTNVRALVCDVLIDCRECTSEEHPDAGRRVMLSLLCASWSMDVDYYDFLALSMLLVQLVAGTVKTLLIVGRILM